MRCPSTFHLVVLRNKAQSSTSPRMSSGYPPAFVSVKGFSSMKWKFKSVLSVRRQNRKGEKGQTRGRKEREGREGGGTNQ